MKRYDSYLFDLYGTLVDIHTDERRPGFWREMAAWFSSQGASCDAQTLRSRYLTLCGAETARMTAESGLPDTEIEIDLYPVFSALLSERGVLPDRERIEQTAWEFRRASTGHIRLFAGAKELLLALRAHGKRVFLLSNAQALFTLPELERLGIADCFDGRFLSSDYGVKKPARQFIQALLDKHGLDASRCLMIGNDPHSDVAVAKTVGMDSFYLQSGQSPRIDPRTSGANYVQAHISLKRLQTRLLGGG